MALLDTALTPRVTQVLQRARQFSATERLALAKLLLDSLLAAEIDEEADWSALSLVAFEKDWDNADDAIYDNWREQYGVQSG